MKINRNCAVTALPSCSCGGRLASHLDGFATLLASEGYAAGYGTMKTLWVNDGGTASTGAAIDVPALTSIFVVSPAIVRGKR